MTGCGFQKETIENPYSLYESSSTASASQLFAKNLCVTDDVNYGTDKVDSNLAESAGVFNVDTKEVFTVRIYSKNCTRQVPQKF